MHESGVQVSNQSSPVDARTAEQQANEWAQQVLDRELPKGATDEQLGRLLLGAAILINGLAQLGRLEPAEVASLVERYRERLVVVDKRSRCHA